MILEDDEEMNMTEEDEKIRNAHEHIKDFRIF